MKEGAIGKTVHVLDISVSIFCLISHSVSLFARTVILQFEKSCSYGSYVVGEPASLTGGVAILDRSKSSFLTTLSPCCDH